MVKENNTELPHSETYIRYTCAHFSLSNDSEYLFFPTNLPF
jgi:hypothetical protein